jgi:hypothetical protein
VASNPIANAAGGILGGLYTQQQAATTTITTQPGQLIYPSTWTYQSPVAADPFPHPFPDYPHTLGFIGHFRIRQLENGYIVEYQLKEGDRMREYFAEDLKDAGERITALCVEKALKGETPK